MASANPAGASPAAPSADALEDVARLFQRAFLPAGASAELRQLAQSAAEAAKARLQCFADQARREAEGVQQILSALAGPRRPTARQRRAAAQALLELLNESSDVLNEESELTLLFGVRLTGLLARRYPADPLLQAWHTDHLRARKIR